MPFEPLMTDAARFCYGLSHLGHTPPAAIIDLIDNAVTAGAKKITVSIVTENDKDDNDGRGRVNEFLVIDDGAGMDEEGIKNALILGSAATRPVSETSPGLGLGLKSAAFSQGDRLEILSSSGDASFIKYRVDLQEIFKRGFYGTEQVNLVDEDETFIHTYLQEGRGTIVRISAIRQSNNFSTSMTVNELHRQIGELYSPERGPLIDILLN